MLIKFERGHFKKKEFYSYSRFLIIQENTDILKFVKIMTSYFTYYFVQTMHIDQFWRSAIFRKICFSKLYKILEKFGKNSTLWNLQKWQIFLFTILDANQF